MVTNEYATEARPQAVTLVFSPDPQLVRWLSDALAKVRIRVAVCSSRGRAEAWIKGSRFHALCVDSRAGADAWALLQTAQASKVNSHTLSVAVVSNFQEFRTAMRLGVDLVMDRPQSQEAAEQNVRAIASIVARDWRRTPRYAAGLQATLCLPGEDHEVTVTNISSSGVSISVEKKVSVGATAVLSFRLPVCRTTFTANVKIVWTQEGRAGLQFQSVAKDAQARLSAWLATVPPEVMTFKTRPEDWASLELVPHSA